MRRPPSHAKRRTHCRYGKGQRVREPFNAQPLVSTTNPTTVTGKIVQQLVKLNTLIEITGPARHRRFRSKAYVPLFEEEARA
jgi:hypothetical protein